MSETIRLKAEDGHEFDCYCAHPAGQSRGALLVIQEIFGVNSHMRSVTDRFAGEGYTAYCPALYDRAQRGFEVGYDPDDINAGRDMRARIGWDQAVMDMKATVEALSSHGKVGSVGYCWGGSLSWLVATRIGVAASVCYYGGQIVQFIDEKPRNPVMMHFGEIDKSIPMVDVEKIRSVHPEAEVFVYSAGHGFSCDQRADFDQPSSDTAFARTIEFFRRHVG